MAGLLEANGIYNVKLLVNRVRPDMIQSNSMMSVRDVQVRQRGGGGVAALWGWWQLKQGEVVGQRHGLVESAQGCATTVMLRPSPFGTLSPSFPPSLPPLPFSLPLRPAPAPDHPPPSLLPPHRRCWASRCWAPSPRTRRS